MDLDLIIKYLEGQISEEEKKALDKWIQSDKENEKEFELIKKAWQAPEQKLPKPDVEKALQNVKNKIELNKSKQQKIYKLADDKTESTFNYAFKSNFFKAAASIIIVIGAIYLYNVFSQKPEVKQITFAADTKVNKTTLLDGTEVTLDIGSILTYPDKFDENSRTVSLTGEALFNVIHDPAKPFSIKANDGVIEVLGTEFNIRTWNNKLTVVVSKGKVSLNPQNGTDKNNEVILTKGRMSVMKLDGKPSAPEKVDVDEYINWQNREKYFKGTQFVEIVKQLERWYKVKINYPDKNYDNDLLTISLKNEPIEEIIELISVMMKFNYKIENDVITFSASN